MTKNKIEQLSTQDLGITLSRLKTRLGFEIAFTLVFLLITLMDYRDIIFGGNLQDLPFNYITLSTPILTLCAIYTYSRIRKMKAQLAVNKYGI